VMRDDIRKMRGRNLGVFLGGLGVTAGATGLYWLLHKLRKKKAEEKASVAG
jgi:hypothetical protein